MRLYAHCFERSAPFCEYSNHQQISRINDEEFYIFMLTKNLPSPPRLDSYSISCSRILFGSARIAHCTEYECWIGFETE